MSKITIEELDKIATEYVDCCVILAKEKCVCRYRAGHIFDPNQTVNWNREEVLRKNAEYAAEAKRLREEKNKLYNLFVSQAQAYIKEQLSGNTKFSCTDAYAKRVFDYVLEYSGAVCPDSEDCLHYMCQIMLDDVIGLIKDAFVS